MRRLVNFVRRSCAISFKAAKSRHNSALEELKQRLRRILRRDLTAHEEHLLELSAPILGSDLNESEPEQENNRNAA